MQKWEFIILTFRLDELYKWGSWDDGPFTPREERLNQLGKEGWEIVAVFQSHQEELKNNEKRTITKYEYNLKRPLEKS
jgi:hypothetical protein